ncbi:MFS transporter [Bdellovibrio bacteriovorus]|nr:MFS transporter [Bdellovibrio bacteriovorus]
MTHARFSHKTLILLAYIGFISLGLPDAVHGIAWPRIRPEFDLSQVGLGSILAFGGAGYLLSSFFTGKILSRMHVGTLLGVSTSFVALGLLGYGFTTSWPVFLICAFLIGSGSGAIDGGLNSYVSKNFSASHMSWLHGCYGIGATLGPIIMTQSLVFGTWRHGYLILGLCMTSLAMAFAWTRSIWEIPATSPDKAKPESAPPATLFEALKSKSVILQALLFFFYAGVEVTVAQWSFSLNTGRYGMSIELAGLMSVAFWVSLTAGRFLMGFLVAKLGIDHLLNFSFLGACAGAVLLNVPLVIASTLAHVVLGFSLSAIYPLLMSITSRRVGLRLTDYSIGLQVSAATLGIMIVPTIAGLISQNIGLVGVPIVVVVTAAVLGSLHLLARKPARGSAG